MVIQLYLPIYTYPPYHLLISGKLTLPQKILEVSSDFPLLFRGEKYAMQVQYTFQVATEFFFLTVNILLLLVLIGQLI